MENKIAIVVVAFNRLPSVTRLLSSLSSAEYADNKVDLIVSIDKSNTDIVEKYADGFDWKYGEKIVVKHEQNLGLRAHMLSLGQHFEFYDALVILEDDIVVSPRYYYYVQQTVDKYSCDDNIGGISLYAYHMNYQNNLPFEPIKSEYDVYFMQCAMSWGQIWLKKQWLRFYDWYNKHTEFTKSISIPQALYTWPKSSWLKYHIRYCIENDKYFVYPYYSLVTDFSDVGTHNDDADNNTVYQVPMQRGHKTTYELPDYDLSQIRYDGFFECMNLYDVLGLNKDLLCIDLYGEKDNREECQYWLTFRKKNFKIAKSYSLNYRPAEANIIENNVGSHLFLYDTQVKEKNKFEGGKRNILFRFYLQSTFSFMRMYGIGDYFVHPISIFIKKGYTHALKFFK